MHLQMPLRETPQWSVSFYHSLLKAFPLAMVADIVDTTALLNG